MARTRTLSHDEAVAWARAAVARVSPGQACRAFVRSLSIDPRLRPGRAVLAAFAVARHLPAHTFQPTQLFSTRYVCGVCQYGATHGEALPLDLDELEDTLAREGSALFMAEPAPLAYVLERAATLGDAEPTAHEAATLRDLLAALQSAVDAARAAPGRASFRKEALDAIGRVFRSNKYARAWVLETFGWCGVLRVPGRPGFADRFVPLDERPDPPERNNELQYPTGFWRAADGLDAARVQELFGAWLTT